MRFYKDKDQQSMYDAGYELQHFRPNKQVAIQDGKELEFKDTPVIINETTTSNRLQAWEVWAKKLYK